MDLKHHPTTQTPDPENETPLNHHHHPHPHPQSINNLLSFSNGKTNHHHHPPPPTAVVVAYRECLKNHAATIGGHALDGCGEFMPSPTSTPTEPTSLKCAACGCHRNFHRREPTTATAARSGIHFIEFNRHPHQITSTSTSPSPPSPPPQPTSYAYGGPPHHLLLSLSTAADQGHTAVATPGTPPVPIKIENGGGGGRKRKRFRTKFSQDQKEKMLGFAEKVGWKMQRCGDKMVVDFCNEIGIRRGIFKVWMHNNKNTFRKREKEDISGNGNSPATTTATATNNHHLAAGVVRSNDDSVHQENGNLQASTNGSSSSS